MPRKYDLGRRAAAAEQTRRRIVDATVALHAEQGIVATTYKDIAQRADVGVGTVYNHFPTVDDAKAFAASEVHQAAMAEMDELGFEYTHFAGLWQLVAPRERHVICDACGSSTTMPADSCRSCGVEIADVFQQRNRARSPA